MFSIIVSLSTLWPTTMRLPQEVDLCPFVTSIVILCLHLWNKISYNNDVGHRYLRCWIQQTVSSGVWAKYQLYLPICFHFMIVVIKFWISLNAVIKSQYLWSSLLSKYKTRFTFNRFLKTKVIVTIEIAIEVRYRWVLSWSEVFC